MFLTEWSKELFELKKVTKSMPNTMKTNRFPQVNIHYAKGASSIVSDTMEAKPSACIFVRMR